METNKLHQLFLDSSGVSTDTRKIKQDNIFFALKGENFNGNLYAQEALKAGAKYAVIDEKPDRENSRLILVADVLASLQNLASFHRHQLGLPVIALTGSNGKTTTKELINAGLSQKYKTLATQGNLNNHIGVPLTLLSLTSETEIGIIEMGANHPKEIAALCRIAQPDFGYITNFGKAHLEGFKSPEGVIAAKSELYDYLKENGKTLFLNIDDPVQAKQSFYENKFTFGTSDEADIEIEYLLTQTYAIIKAGENIVSSNLIGGYNAKNMAAAYCIGRYFKVAPHELKEGIESYSPKNNRSQIIEKNSNKIILDAYNANPTSMAAALDNFDTIQDPYKIAVLGDMFELGAYSREEHQTLVERLENSSVDAVYLIGKNFHQTKSGNSIKKFQTFEEFTASLEPEKFKNATILVKGSRGMALERILDLI